MRAAAAPLRIASATIAGTLAGGMLLIEIVLVPFWRGLPPREFRAWFGEHSGRIRSVMAPLGAAGAGAALATTAAEAATGGAPARAAVAAAGTSAVVAITLTVNEPANAKFEQPDFDDAETTALLRRWTRWHHVRVALGFVAAAAAASTAAARR